MQQQEAHNINTSQTKKGKSKKEKAKDIQPPHVRLMHKYRGSKSACTKEEQNISDPAFLYNKTHYELKHAQQNFIKKISILSKDWAAYANSLEGNLKDLQLQRLENYMKEMSDTMDLLDQRIGEIGPKENVNLQAADSTSGGEESDNQENENTEKNPTPERFSGFHDDQVEHLASLETSKRQEEGLPTEQNQHPSQALPIQEGDRGSPHVFNRDQRNKAPRRAYPESAESASTGEHSSWRKKATKHRENYLKSFRQSNERPHSDNPPIRKPPQAQSTPWEKVPKLAELT